MNQSNTNSQKIRIQSSVSDEELKNYRNYYVYDTDENPYSVLVLQDLNH